MNRIKMFEIAKKIEERIADITAKEFETEKFGRLLYGLEICKGNMHPCIYFNDFPDDEDEENIIKFVEATLNDAGKYDVDVLTDRDYWLSNLQINLISNSFKQELIEKNVYVEDFLDMTLYYVCNVFKNGQGIGIIKITNDLMERFEFTPLVLRRYAEFNMSTEMYIKPILSVLSELNGVELPPDDLEIPMYILSNNSKCNGAGMIALKFALDNLQRILGPEIFILPSSKHEVIAVNAVGHDVHELYNMVAAVNNTQLAPEDRLSYSVYRYDGNKLTIA